MNAQVQPVVIAVLVVLEVAVWQVRVALATRGRKRGAALLGAVNAVLTVAAIGQVVTNLDRPANIAGYAIGVGVGVYLGVLADARFAGDPVEYRVVVPGDGGESAGELTNRGWSVTTEQVDRFDGPATVLTLVASSNRTTQLERDLEQVAPDAFTTSVRLRSASLPRTVAGSPIHPPTPTASHQPQPVPSANSAAQFLEV